MLKELTFTFRRLAQRPSFTLPAIATLAVGVGATTAIFSTVNATLLRPLPYPQAEDIYTLNTTLVDGRWTSGRVASAYITAISSLAPSVMQVAGVVNSPQVIIADDGRNRQVLSHYVTEGFFDLVGLPMALGRAPTAEDPTDGMLGPAVLSYQIWDQMFGRDPEVVGQTLRFISGPATVVGVAPPEFDIPRGTDVWIGVTPSPTSTADIYEAFLRVRPGTNPDRLRSELAGVMAGLAETDPGGASGRAFITRPLVNAIVGDLGPILLMVLVGAVVLLALGCVNVATLVLARGGVQTREFAVRKAFGANRSSILRQLLTESFVLSSAGTAIGLFLAYLGVRALLAFGAAGLPRLEDVPFDTTVLLFAVAALVGITMLVGLLPAVRLWTPDVRGILSEGGGRSATGGLGSRRFLSGLVVAEIALAITLVAGAGWLVRSYANLSETDPGFVADGRLVFEAVLLGSAYMPVSRIVHGSNGPNWVPDRTGNNPQMWLDELTRRLEVSDQVSAVGSTATLPLRRDWDAMVPVSVPGEPYDPNAQDNSRLRRVSPGFFEAMGISVIAGRTFTDDDPPSAAIVNEAFVRAYLGGKDPLTESFAWGSPLVDFENLWTIVGVVGDVHYRSLREPAEPTFYALGYSTRGTVVVSTSLSDPMSLASTVQAAANAVDPSIPITIEPLEAVLSDELLRHRLGLILMSLFAAVSLALAGIGIYGVVGHGTSQRSGEFAVRMAVGASPSSIVRLVMTQGGTLWVVGTVMGLGAAYVAGRLSASWLYEVRASDPLILIIAVSAVLAFTLLAFLLPALRGSRVQLAEVLRAD